MFDSILEIMRTIAPSERQDSVATDIRTASAALLFHVIDADGVVTETEQARLKQALSEEYGLDDIEADKLARAGQAADAEAVDLYHFTSILKNNLEESDRIRFVERLWDVTFADGTVHELEDNVIWRVADLLGVSTRDRMLMKREASRNSEVSD